MKPLLNPHVFGQSMFNWLPFPAEVGEVTEVPIPPVEGLSEVLVFLTAMASGEPKGEHYYAIFTRSLDGSPVPFHYLFLAGGNVAGGGTINSDNFWLPMPGKGLPRIVYVQKMSGPMLKPSESFKTGIALLALR
jgi:hypothetical protein